MSQQGKIKFFDTKKGFGFIRPNEGDKNIFVHRNNIVNLGFDQGFNDDEVVEFDVQEKPEGLFSAINVRSLDSN